MPADERGWDLVAAMRRDKRKEVPFTVLHRIDVEKKGWKRDEIKLLSSKFPTTEIYNLRSRPFELIILGEYSREQIAAAIGDSNIGQHKIVFGYDNPDLPFVPPSGY